MWLSTILYMALTDVIELSSFASLDGNIFAFLSQHIIFYFSKGFCYEQLINCEIIQLDLLSYRMPYTVYRCYPHILRQQEQNELCNFGSWIYGPLYDKMVDFKIMIYNSNNTAIIQLTTFV